MAVESFRESGLLKSSAHYPAVHLNDRHRNPSDFNTGWSNSLVFISLAVIVALIVFLVMHR